VSLGDLLQKRERIDHGVSSEASLLDVRRRRRGPLTLFPSLEAPAVYSLTVSVTYEAALEMVSAIPPELVVLVVEALQRIEKVSSV
jgi:hypothetical protein